MTAFAQINNAGDIVGTTHLIDVYQNQIPATIPQQYNGVSDTIVLYNESGVGYLVFLGGPGGQGGSQRSFSLPAGGWTSPIPLSVAGVQDTTVLLIAKYVMVNPLVSLVLIDYYNPNEEHYLSHALGNSPIGGTITVPSTPTIAFQPIANPLPITTTSATNVFSFTIPTTGLYGVYASIFVNNGGTATISMTVQFTSGFDGSANTRNIATQGGVALSSLVLANGTYGTTMASFMCKISTNLILTYQDSTNTPSDSFIAGALKLF